MDTTTADKQHKHESASAADSNIPRRPGHLTILADHEFDPDNPLHSERIDTALFHASDVGNANLFVARYGRKVRYDHARRRWLIYEGHRWIPDADAAIMRLAAETAQYRGLAAHQHLNGDARQAEIRFALKSESERALDSMLTLARTMKPITDTGKAWDTNPYLLGCENGVIEFTNPLRATPEDPAWRFRDGQPEDNLTMSTGIRFDPTAECPRWTTFLEHAFEHDQESIDYVHQLAGYTATGKTNEEILVLLYGGGGNGKTTLLNALKSALGEYTDDLPSQSLVASRDVGAGRASPDIAKLVGKRCVTSREFNERAAFNEARVKAMTSTDPQTARFLHGNYFTFEPQHTLWLATNHKPTVTDASDGFWRRVRLIPMRVPFEKVKDRDLRDKLEDEATGILLWIAEGYRRYFSDRNLTMPEKIQAATDDYRTEQDELALFIGERCTEDPNTQVAQKDLLDAYSHWAAEARIRNPLNHKTFGSAIEAKGYQRTQHQKAWIVHGLTLSDAAQTGLFGRDQ